MPEPVQIEVWALLGQWIIYGGSFVGAVWGIIKFISWLRSKTTTAKLEVTVKQHSEWLDNDNKRLNTLEINAHRVDQHEELLKKSEERLKMLENDVAESKRDREELHDLSRMTLVALQELLKSSLEGGNNRAGMQKAYDEIKEFLNNKI